MTKKLTPAQFKERAKKIKAFSKQGLSERQIAKKVHTSRSTVYYWLNK